MRDQESRSSESGALLWSSLPAELRDRFSGHKPAYPIVKEGYPLTHKIPSLRHGGTEYDE
jgi:hypothetical protein